MSPAEFEIFLEEISVSYLDRDFPRWMARVRLPFTFVTKDGPVLLSDLDAAKVNFDHYLTAIDVMRLDMISRRAVSLEDCKDGTFIGTYVTELLSHGKRATEPYTSSVLLHPSDAGWRMSAVMNARGHHQWTGQTPLANREKHD